MRFIATLLGLRPEALSVAENGASPVRKQRRGAIVRKGFFSFIVGGAVLTATLIAGAAGAVETETFHFTETISGAKISATEAVFKVHRSGLGSGAAVQVLTLGVLAGSDRETSYYGNASSESHGTFKLGTPDANGVSKLTGQGHETSGTGKLTGIKSTYTYTGTFNINTMVFKAVAKGTGSTT